MKWLILFILFSGCARAQLPVTGKVPGKIELNLRCEYEPGTARFETVVFTIHNNTDSIASFYETWNIWGQNYRLEVVTDSSTFTLYPRTYDPTHNFPSFIPLLPGDSMVTRFNFKTGFDWRSHNYPVHIRKMRVIYSEMDIENHENAWGCGPEHDCPDCQAAVILNTYSGKRKKLMKRFLEDRSWQKRSFLLCRLESPYYEFSPEQ